MTEATNDQLLNQRSFSFVLLLDFLEAFDILKHFLFAKTPSHPLAFLPSLSELTITLLIIFILISI